MIKTSCVSQLAKTSDTQTVYYYMMRVQAPSGPLTLNV